MDVSKLLELNELYDQYNSLLTDKQRDYFNLYFEEDLSLSEIAEQLGVSRNAIHKQLKAIEKVLYNYEEKLGLVKKNRLIYKLIEETNDSVLKEKLESLLGE